MAAKGAPDKPREVVILIELLGQRRKPFDSTLDSKRKAAMEKRFLSFGFVKKAPNSSGSVLDAPDDTMTWLDEQWAKVLQALALVPDEMLMSVSGISWVRGRGALGPSKEAGHYQTQTGLPANTKAERTLTLFDDTFKTDDTIIRTIVHELGHAISEKPMEPQRGTALSASADYQRAARTDGGKAVTEYGKKNWEEHYAESYSLFIAEPSTLKAMRPTEFAWFEKQQKDAARRP